MFERAPGEQMAASAVPRRRRWLGRLAVIIAVTYQVFAISDLVAVMHRPTPGLFLMPAGPLADVVVAMPTTEQAEAALAGLRRPLMLRAINGAPLPKTALQVTKLQRRLRQDRPGTVNRFEIRGRHGARRTVSLTVASGPGVGAFARWAALNFLYHLGGLLYLAVGLLVWWRRPGDHAAFPLLWLCTIGAVQMTLLVPSGPIGWTLSLIKIGTFPLWGVAALVLAQRFIGCDNRRRARWLVIGSAVVSLGLGAVATVGSVSERLLVAAPWLARSVSAVTGLLLVFLVGAMFVTALVEARRQQVPALRRRARVLAAAFMVSFMLPSLAIVLQAAGLASPWLALGVLISLTAFPLIVGYAIVRHQLFDLRLVLRRSAVYVTLSLLVSLAYVSLALLALKAVKHSPSPLFIGASVAVLVVLFGLIHVRIQRAVDRFVFRTRYVYADAIARASAGLTLDRNLETICDTVRTALVDAMGLSRIYLAVWQDQRRGELRCISVGGSADEARSGPPPLPERLNVGELPPVERALCTVELVSAHDLRAVAAQSDEASGGDGRTEGSFWSHFGVEAIIPLSLGAETSVSRVVGLLLLGNKADDRPMDAEDHRLLQTLANQLAVAVESVNAMEEIQRLNDQLERRVAARTVELSDALDELKQAEGRLVESETQAALTRFVAGILHEVNSPLGTMRSSVDTVARVLERCRPALEAAAAGDRGAAKALAALDRGRDSADVARSSAERIGEVMNSLQRFVSLDEAQVKLLDVRRGVADAQTLIAPSLGEAVTVDVVSELSDGPPPLVRCEPAKLNRVFLNLLSNAVNAVKGEGLIRVAISLAQGRVLVDFVDDGEGIEPERLEQLFDIGFTTKRGRVGLRLGLPSAKRWVEELGGSLTVESQVGRGTRVRVALPAAAGVDPAGD